MITNVEIELKDGREAVLSLTIDVPQQWIDLITMHNDIFSTLCIGYWAKGMDVQHDKGWLVLEEALDDWDADQENAHMLWRTFQELPKGYHRFDTAFAIKVFCEGVKILGADWWTTKDHDFETYDSLIQSTLFNEIRYA